MIGSVDSCKCKGHLLFFPSLYRVMPFSVGREKKFSLFVLLKKRMKINDARINKWLAKEEIGEMSRILSIFHGTEIEKKVFFYIQIWSGCVSANVIQIHLYFQYVELSWGLCNVVLCSQYIKGFHCSRSFFSSTPSHN